MNKRGPLITIEGTDAPVIRILTDHIAKHITTPVSSSPRYNENTSPIGSLVARARRNGIDFQDIVRYNLRVANIWEQQEDVQHLCEDGVTVIINKYVFSNRADLISWGSLSVESCPRLDAGLIKPDLQVFVSSDPVTITAEPPLFYLDDFHSRQRRTMAYDHMATRYPDLVVINNKPCDILEASEQLTNLVDELNQKQLPLLQYFDGSF